MRNHYALLTKLLTTPASTPKPYEAIPGPKGYPFIGTILDYRNDKYTMSNAIKKRLDKFGPIYRESMFPGFSEQVIVFDPKDAEVVFRADDKMPLRPMGGDTMELLMKAAG